VIAKTAEEQKILDFLEPILSGIGYELVDLDFHPGSRSLLRLFIEQTGCAKNSIKLEDCVKVSRHLDVVLEKDEIATLLPPLKGAFDLEVSSPGLDRRLRKKEDFESAVGQEVFFSFSEKLPGIGAQRKATLEKVEGSGLKVSFDKQNHEVSWGLIRKAHVVWKPENATLKGN